MPREDLLFLEGASNFLLDTYVADESAIFAYYDNSAQVKEFKNELSL